MCNLNAGKSQYLTERVEDHQTGGMTLQLGGVSPCDSMGTSCDLKCFQCSPRFHKVEGSINGVLVKGAHAREIQNTCSPTDLRREGSCGLLAT